MSSDQGGLKGRLFNAGDAADFIAPRRDDYAKMQQEVNPVEPPREVKLAKLFQMYLDADKDYIAAVETLAKLALEENEWAKKRAEALSRALKAKAETLKLMVNEEVPSMLNPSVKYEALNWNPNEAPKRL